MANYFKPWSVFSSIRSSVSEVLPAVTNTKDKVDDPFQVKTTPRPSETFDFFYDYPNSIQDVLTKISLNNRNKVYSTSVKPKRVVKHKLSKDPDKYLAVIPYEDVFNLFNTLNKFTQPQPTVNKKKKTTTSTTTTKAPVTIAKKSYKKAKLKKKRKKRKKKKKKKKKPKKVVIKPKKKVEVQWHKIDGIKSGSTSNIFVNFRYAATATQGYLLSSLFWSLT